MHAPSQSCLEEREIVLFYNRLDKFERLEGAVFKVAFAMAPWLEEVAE